jgi:CRP/FNR family cyclic AMP-dependent transcriptional regulator
MFNPENLKDASIAKLIRKLANGETLFQQGELGKTMFVILSGTIVLVEKAPKINRLVGTLHAGEMLGEKALLKDGQYRRSFTALAKTEVILIEIDESNLKTIFVKIPDFLMKMLKMMSERLDKANELTRILQSTNSTERLIQYLGYFAKYHGKKTSSGSELTLNTEEIGLSINVEKPFIEEALKVLVAQKILIKNTDHYLLADENALQQQLPALKERLAA